MPSLDPVPDHVLARRRRIGMRIRDARLHADLTQERLGELTDMHRNTIVNIELGIYSPRLDSLLLIADAVRVPLSDLVRE
jgi:transcriptional regulator with XRE-family HTH domain